MSLIRKYTETYGLTQFITCRVQFLVIPLKDSVCVYVGILYVCVCVLDFRPSWEVEGIYRLAHTCVEFTLINKHHM